MKRKLLLFLVLLFALPTPIHAEGSLDIAPLNSLDLASDHYIMIDRESGTILAERLSEEPVYPASITKVLTVITALEKLEGTDLTTTVVLDPDIFDGLDPIASIAGFNPYDSVTVEDLLYGVLLPSGADATRALSYYLTGDPENLVDDMNRKAQAIGMQHSHFMNTTGLDHPLQQTTAYDLSLLIQHALKNPTFKQIYEAKSYTTSPTPAWPNGIELVNDKLTTAHELGYTMIKGTKSGTTELAGRALSSYAEQDNRSFIFISVNAPSEAEDYAQVKDHGKAYRELFDHYHRETFVRKGTTLQTLPIKNGKHDFEITFSQDLYNEVPNDLNPQNLKFEVIPAQESFRAPIPAGTLMAEVKASYNGKTLIQQAIVNEEPIELSKVKILMQTLQTIGIISLIVGLSLLLIYGIYKQVDDYRAHQLYLRREERRKQKENSTDMD